MKKPILISSSSNNLFRERIYLVTLAFIMFGITSCTEINVDSLQNDNSIDKVTQNINPHKVLSPKGIIDRSPIASSSHAKQGPKTDNTGFSSPLFGLTTAPNGDILVADAGAGIASLSGTEIPLPGVTDISPIGRSAHWATTGAGEDPEEDTGQALYRTSQGKAKMVVNLFAFEEASDPDGKVDSNPFDVQSLGGNAALVADAGGNDLLHIDKQGNVNVMAVFPDEHVSTENIKNLLGCPEGPPNICDLPGMIPAEAVPTSIAVGPDGYYYIGELKGFPAPAGASNIWKVAPGASWAECGNSPDCVKVFEGGFTSIIDLAFDSNGTLYVAELDELSWFAVEVLGPEAITGGTINACNLSDLSCTEVATGIPILTAITFGNDGSLWATQNSLIPGMADVIKVQ